MFTCRLATWSVVNVLDPFDSAIVSPRLIAIACVTVPVSSAVGWSVWPPSVTVYASPATRPVQVSTCVARSAVHVGKPVDGVTAAGNAEIESGSPTGTERLTSEPARFGVAVSCGWNVRLSFEPTVTTSLFATGEIGWTERPDSVPQKSVGDSCPAPLSVKPSTPVWKHGPMISAGLPASGRDSNGWLFVRNSPLSRSVHPVQPDSVNGSPPLPVRITWWSGDGTSEPLLSLL